MKRTLIIAALLFSALAGWRMLTPAPPTLVETGDSVRFGPPPEIVFQKAFWRRPGAADEILHAERREQQDGSWQWFIQVRPSAELVSHLITDNAFGLSTQPRSLTSSIKNAPKWFPQLEKALTNASGSFCLHFDREAGLITATDSGGGFRPGAPEPRIVSQTAETAAGRLPRHLPPNPPKP
jgi:hypothetical protein